MLKSIWVKFFLVAIAFTTLKLPIIENGKNNIVELINMSKSVNDSTVILKAAKTGAINIYLMILFIGAGIMAIIVNFFIRNKKDFNNNRVFFFLLFMLLGLVIIPSYFIITVILA